MLNPKQNITSKGSFLELTKNRIYSYNVLLHSNKVEKNYCYTQQYDRCAEQKKPDLKYTQYIYRRTAFKMVNLGIKSLLFLGLEEKKKVF